MRRFPKLRPGLWDGVTAGVILLLAVLSASAFWRSGRADGLTAAVYTDGAETERIALDRAGVSEMRVYSGNGYSVRVRFWSGTETEDIVKAGVQVIWADCPTQDCVRTGQISRIGQSIICLPARIVIRLEGGAEMDPSAPDAVLG